MMAVMGGGWVLVGIMAAVVIGPRAFKLSLECIMTREMA